MNSLQLRHFMNLLAKKKRKLMQIYCYNQETKKSAEVLRAERIIKDWEKANNAKRSSIYEQVESVISKLEIQFVLFGPENASVIQALNDLDNWKPQ